MKQRAARDVTGLRARLLTCVLLCVACALALWSPGGRSQAQQQQQERQLVQTDGAPAGRRLALVIGNAAYTNAPVLKNPLNDARDMANTLSRLGFEVEHGADLDQRQMKAMIRQFGQKLKAGGQGVFYYAGHGVQSKGRNYLIPVDAVIESEADVEDAGVDVQLMLSYMDDAQNGLNIVILDACRNNPFARSFRSAENGLAQVDAPTGTLIAYATAPGRVASDGAGRNGLYTSELLKQMEQPGLSVLEMFMRVRAEVVRKTGGKQVPWEASSLIGSFSFNAGGAPSVTLKEAAAVEAEYWEAVKNSAAAADYQEYLKEYPQGRYAQLARLKLRQLEAAKSSRNNSDTSATKAEPHAGMIVRNQLGMEFAYIPAGSFLMGTTDAEVQRVYKDVNRYYPSVNLRTFDAEKPQHKVAIGKGFYIGRHEVTQAQWEAVMGDNPSEFKNCALCPVERVSWNDAKEFIRRMNARGDGFTYRLPTEAEWEYACRAGTTTSFAFGNSISSAQANFLGSSKYGGGPNGVYRAKTVPVGSFQPNAWGLYDMHGNVAELCEDLWHENYNGAPNDGTAWSSGGRSDQRVGRGGSWSFIANTLRSASRMIVIQYYGDEFTGLRVAAVKQE